MAVPSACRRESERRAPEALAPPRGDGRAAPKGAHDRVAGPCACAGTAPAAALQDLQAAAPAPRRVVILGIGNTILSDEGAGVHAAAHLRANCALPPGVEVIDGGTAGMELLDALTGVDLLLVLDAVKSGRAPGSIVCLAGREVPVFFRSKLSPHQVSICDVLASLEFAGQAPRDLVLVGIEPASLELGLEPTPQVAARVPQMVALALEQLALRGVHLRAAAAAAA